MPKVQVGLMANSLAGLHWQATPSHLEQLLSPELEDGSQLVLAKQLSRFIPCVDSAPCGVHALNHQMIQHHLLLGAVQDVLLHTVAGQEPAGK